MAASTTITNGSRSRRVKKVATSIALVAIASIGVMGFLHTKMGKPLLMKLGGCPVGNVSAQDMEEVRAKAFAASQPATETPPPSMFALGFELDKATIKDVTAWAASHNITCDDSREGSVLVCANVSAKDVPIPEDSNVPFTELTFGFRASDKALYTVTGWRQDVSPEAAAAAMTTVGTKMVSVLGQPHVFQGKPTSTFLASEGMPTSVISYKFTGYTASVSASKMPAGVWVREVYVSTKVNPVPNTEGSPNLRF